MKTTIIATLATLAIICLAADAESMTAFFLSKVVGIAIVGLIYLIVTNKKQNSYDNK